MRKYGTNDAADNRVGLNLGAFLDTPKSPKIRQLENYKLDNYVHDDVRNGLSAFVEVHSPEFTGKGVLPIQFGKYAVLNLTMQNW